MSYFRPSDGFIGLDEEDQKSLFGKLTKQTKKRYSGGVNALRTDSLTRQKYYQQPSIPDAVTFNNIPTNPTSKSLLNTSELIGPALDTQKAAKNFANAMQSVGKTGQMAAQGTKSAQSFSVPGMPAGLTFTKNAAGKLGLGIDPIGAMSWLFGMWAKDKQAERQGKLVAQITPQPRQPGDDDEFSFYTPSV